MKKLILIGGGGHCKSVIDVVESTGKYKIEGILDIEDNVGKDVLGYRIVGTDNDIDEWHRKGCLFLITVGSLKSAAIRETLFKKIKDAGGRLPVIISSKAHVSAHAAIQEGTVVGHYAIINAGAEIGENCIINTASLIEHETRVGSHSHISTTAVVNGQCVIGNHVFVGSNSVIINNIAVTDYTVIGAGSVVVRHIKEQGVYAGNPIKRIANND